MVTIILIPNSKSQTDEIVEFLLREKYLLTVLIKEDQVEASINAKNQTVRTKKTIISGIIRTVQFADLNNRLREMYPSDMPTFYSTPIVHMDPKQSEAIADYITVVK